MARRKGGLTELLEIVSALPWKVSAALVPISFIVLHVIAVASDHVAAPTDLAGLGPVVIKTYFHTFALILQYIVPFACLIGAGISFAKRTRSASLLTVCGVIPTPMCPRSVGGTSRFWSERGFAIGVLWSPNVEASARTVGWICRWRGTTSDFWSNASSGGRSRWVWRWCGSCMAL